LLLGRKFRWNIRYRILFLINLILTPLISLILTFSIYLNRIDFAALKGNMYGKFLFRSNLSSFTSGDVNAIKTYFSEYFTKFTFHLGLGFGQYYIYFFIAVILLTLISFRLKIKSINRREILIIVCFFIIAPLIHYVVLNQFHYWHDFGNLYMFFPVVFLFFRSFYTIGKLIDKKFNKKGMIVKSIFGTGVLAVIVYSSLTGYKDYFRDWLWVPVYFPDIYKNMNKSSTPNDLILTNHDYNPMNWYYYQRAVIGPLIGPDVLNYVNNYPKAANIYYMSDGQINVEQSCGGKPIEFKNDIYYCKLN
jgi:hypothetical protein